MDYEMFLEVVKEKFMDYMPQRYQSGKLEIHAVNKVNVVWDALRISMPDNDRILPDIFVNEMYEKYKETGDLERVFRYTAAEYTNILEKNMKERLELDVNDMKDNVIFVLINTEQNKELIANVPNKPFQDLSVIFRWVISQDAQGMASIIVTKDMMEHAGLTLESLMEQYHPDTVIFEKVERNLSEYIDMPPIISGMETEISQIEETLKSGATVSLESLDYDFNYYKISGKVEKELLGDETDIVVRINDTYYRPYYTGENSYELYMKKEEIRIWPAELEILTEEQGIYRSVQRKNIEEGELLP